jgi:hypothetical protein
VQRQTNFHCKGFKCVVQYLIYLSTHRIAARTSHTVPSHSPVEFTCHLKLLVSPS